MSKYRKFKEYHIEQLRDPEDARIYLSVALEEYEEDGDIEAFLLAVKDVAEARGGLSKLAEHTSHLECRSLCFCISISRD